MNPARILVIDDSTTLRKLVEIAMRGTGVDVDFAATGSDGVNRARSARPDVILLDYLLPDLQSTEVCQQLFDDTTTSRVPVVVMSANHAEVFDAFRKFPAVVGFVGKPFSPTEIRSRLESAIKNGGTAAATNGTRPARRTVPPVPGIATATKLELVHGALASALRSRLAEVMAMKPPKNDDVGEFYASQLLDPDTVQGIVDACHGLAEPAVSPQAGELELRGDLMTTPLLELLRLLASSNATGTLTIELADKFRIHIRRGEVLMCTTSRFDDDALGSVPVTAIAAEVLHRARRLQQVEGKPALITLAQIGAIPVNNLPAELHRLAGRLLGELLGVTAGRFAWRASLTLPDYVDAFGRHLSITSIALALRRGPSTELPAVFLDDVYDRTPRFSEKLAGARLSSDEQRVLALVDGRHSVREIVARAETSSDQAAAIFARLRNVDLIRSEGRSGVTEIPGGAVVVVDPDQEFVAPLRAYLARRPQPIEVIAPPIQDLAVHDLASTLMKLRPRLVILNAKLITPELIERDLGPVARAGTITIAAVLDFPEPAEVDELLRAGMHAVLVKPLHQNDLERLLGL